METLVEYPAERSIVRENRWRELPACGATIYRKLEAYATEEPDSYFSNDA
jgi:hypothetical protein